ncbi:MAG: hypothetical protein ACI4K5_02675 [Ruminococcus sp.]
MYLSKGKIIFSNIISSVMLLISCPFVFIGIVGFLMDFFKFLGETDTGIKRELRQSLGVAVGILLFFGTILIISLKRFQLAGKANKFNHIFENDTDGVILMSSVSVIFGIQENKFIKLFDKMIKKGYIVNCYIEYNDTPRIILANQSEQLVAVKCPNCGASNNIKAGQSGICEYCHSEIQYISK